MWLSQTDPVLEDSLQQWFNIGSDIFKDVNCAHIEQ